MFPLLAFKNPVLNTTISLLNFPSKSTTRISSIPSSTKFRHYSPAESSDHRIPLQRLRTTRSSRRIALPQPSTTCPSALTRSCRKLPIIYWTASKPTTLRQTISPTILVHLPVSKPRFNNGRPSERLRMLHVPCPSNPLYLKTSGRDYSSYLPSLTASRVC